MGYYETIFNKENSWIFKYLNNAKNFFNANELNIKELTVVPVFSFFIIIIGILHNYLILSNIHLIGALIFLMIYFNVYNIQLISIWEYVYNFYSIDVFGDNYKTRNFFVLLQLLFISLFYLILVKPEIFIKYTDNKFLVIFIVLGLFGILTILQKFLNYSKIFFLIFLFSFFYFFRPIYHIIIGVLMIFFNIFIYLILIGKLDKQKYSSLLNNDITKYIINILLDIHYKIHITSNDFYAFLYIFFTKMATIINFFGLVCYIQGLVVLNVQGFLFLQIICFLINSFSFFANFSINVNNSLILIMGENDTNQKIICTGSINKK